MWKGSASKPSPKRKRSDASLDTSHYCEPAAHAVEHGSGKVCSFQEPTLQQQEGYPTPDFNAADLISLPSLELPADM